MQVCWYWNSEEFGVLSWKAELKFYGQSFLEGFLGFYGLDVDNALAEYENTLQVLEEQELGQPDKSYYIGVFKKGEAQKWLMKCIVVNLRKKN